MVKQSYELLEEEFGQWMGYKPEQMVACASGSAALHLALECTKQYHKPATLIPDFAMIACARAATLADCEPMFCDCDDTLLMSPKTLPTWTPSIVMPVHIYGRMCDVAGLRKAYPTQTFVEDMAEVHGMRPHLETNAACWSFYKNKVICGEEGGMVYFLNPLHAEKARMLRSHGFSDTHDFQHEPRGMNYRLSNIHADLIRRSLECVNENAEDRDYLENVYDNRMCDLKKIELMPCRDSVWVYDFRIPGMTHEQQRKIVAELNKRGLAARCGFYPLSRQKEYQHLGFQCPNAYRRSAEIIYLPVNPLMTTADVVRNVSILQECIR